MLDPTGQRIVGTLLEKEMAVPDSYPMTLASLTAGCNQKSNRDPVTEFEEWQVEGALEQLRAQGWIVRVDGSRVARWRHAVDDRLGLDLAGKAVLAELLVRGPQAPGALRTRCTRFGFEAAGPDDVRHVLEGLRDRIGDPLVVQLQRQQRERDARWAQTLGGIPDEGAIGHSPAPAPASGHGESDERAVTAPAQPPTARGDLVEDRIAELENRVAELERRLDELVG